MLLKRPDTLENMGNNWDTDGNETLGTQFKSLDNYVILYIQK